MWPARCRSATASGASGTPNRSDRRSAARVAPMSGQVPTAAKDLLDSGSGVKAGARATHATQRGGRAPTTSHSTAPPSGRGE
ncbi:hypothetical protein GCM10022244_29900 [Streptomyces gulbargensis]|uniref:Uncharacterized protein n=1 Tax=Streptomyces gulbargensis TaxID=364901 RepID=A0ABP7MB37_9ACTN